jgi:two-component system sensor histidine kinase CssS
MKKKINFNILSRFSLLSQLLIVFGLVLISFLTIVMPLIQYNANHIIENQMYDMLENTQNEHIPGEIKKEKRKNRLISHLYYDAEKNEWLSDSFDIDYSFANSLYYHVIGNDLEGIVKDKAHKTRTGSGVIDGTTYYYRIAHLTESNTDYYQISFLSNDYSDKLLGILMKRVIYILYAFLLIMAVVLILWVLTFIKPLNKIKEYVNKIPSGEEGELHLNRKDEIGIVGDAIVHMNADIKKQEKAKEEMIHNISHDLKTPIALIKSYGQSVKDDIYPYGDKESSMDIILENANRLEHKVKMLLYLNRLDYLSSEDKKLDSFVMKDLIVRDIVPMQSLNDLDIVLDLDESTFVGNPDHWRVVIENIVDNASRYAKSVIKITVKDGNMTIFNDGEHIDSHQIQDLFDPYVTGVKGQFGLGLSIVKKTCQMYNYNVKAVNEENGVSFIFTK